MKNSTPAAVALHNGNKFTHRIKHTMKECYKYRGLLLLLLPAFIWFAVFKYAPMYGVVVAFKNYKTKYGIMGSQWVDPLFKNFIKLFNTPNFKQVFMNTLIISLLKIALTFPAPIIFALMLNEVHNQRYKKVAIAFATQDPDGNGVADTWALNLSEGHDEITPLAAAFGITLVEGSANQQDSWYVNEEGTAAYKSTTSPEYKELIKYLNELYEAGAIYTDMSLTNAEGDNLAAEGKIGFKHIATIEMLPTYSPQLWYAQMINNVPGAYGTIVEPLEGSVFELQTSPWRYHCFGWNCPDEALIRILEIYEAQCTDMEVHKLIWSGEEGLHYDLVDGMAVKTEAFKSGPVAAGDALKWMIINFRHNAEMQLFTFGHEYANVIAFHNKAGDENAVSKVVNELIPFGVAKPTVDEYKAILDPFEKEFFYNAVAGKIDVEAEWDKYLADWAKMGGEASAQEIYEIWKSMQ